MMVKRNLKDERTSVQVLDMFSGCGGMSYGFMQAKTEHIKFELLGGLDVDRHANATYEKMTGRPALLCDIKELASKDRLQEALSLWGYDPEKPLVLIGCAPCQGFSSHRKKDARLDERNELLSAFGSVAVSLQPDLIVMENVPEMLHKKHWSHFEGFTDQIGESGYVTRARLHNLASFGVPQERYRALVLASRSEGLTEMPQPTHLPSKFATVRDAIGHLPPLVAGETCTNDPMHKTSKHRPATVELISMIPHDGGSRSALPEGVGLDCHQRVDGFRDVYGRLWWDKPAVAITARCRTPSCGRFVHPNQNRGLSIREAGLLQGFPREFQFEGPFDDKYKQIGNAVAPTFAEALAKNIDAAWVGRAPKSSLDGDVSAPMEKSVSSAIAGMKRQLRLAEKLNEVA